jgi:hypothetical protein
MAKLTHRKHLIAAVVGCIAVAVGALLVSKAWAQPAEPDITYQYGELQVGPRMVFETGNTRLTFQTDVFGGEAEDVFDPGDLDDVRVTRRNIHNPKMAILNRLAREGWTVVDTSFGGPGAIRQSYLMRRPMGE